MAKEVPAKPKTSLLGVINVKRQCQLTPKCKKLYLSSIKLTKNFQKIIRLTNLLIKLIK